MLSTATLGASALKGFQDFFTNQGGFGPTTCANSDAGCHALPLGTSANSAIVGHFDAPTMRGMTGRFVQFSAGITAPQEMLSAANAGQLGAGSNGVTGDPPLPVVAAGSANHPPPMTRRGRPISVLAIALVDGQPVSAGSSCTEGIFNVFCVDGSVTVDLGLRHRSHARPAPAASPESHRPAFERAAVLRRQRGRLQLAATRPAGPDGSRLHSTPSP